MEFIHLGQETRNWIECSLPNLVLELISNVRSQIISLLLCIKLWPGNKTNYIALEICKQEISHGEEYQDETKKIPGIYVLTLILGYKYILFYSTTYTIEHLTLNHLHVTLGTHDMC